MWREVVNTGRSWVRERVRRRRRSSVGPPPNWSAQTRVLSATGCPLPQTKLGKRAAGATGSGPGAVVSLRPTIRPLGTSSEARSRAQGWAGIRSRAIAAIGSNSLASLPDRMPVGDFTRLGQGLFEHLRNRPLRNRPPLTRPAAARSPRPNAPPRPPHTTAVVPLFEHLERRQGLFQVVLSLFRELVATAQLSDRSC